MAQLKKCDQDNVVQSTSQVALVTRAFVYLICLLKGFGSKFTFDQIQFHQLRRSGVWLYRPGPQGEEGKLHALPDWTETAQTSARRSVIC